MIIDELALHNIGVFRGTQRVVLTPPSKKKPIVLFGGRNGSGKTTILESLQLVLYGKLADTPRRGHRAYDDYIARLISQDVGPEENAYIELSFRSVEQGKEKNYRLRRAWKNINGRMRENLQFYVDQEKDDALADSWAEKVEQFIPARLCPLFFFDGEQIEGLADVDRSSRILTTALHGLLGLDLIEQLGVDLKSLVRDKRKKTIAGSDGLANQKLARKSDVLEGELNEVNQEIEKTTQVTAAIKTKLGRAKAQLEKAEAKLEENGGDFFEKQQQLEEEHAKLTNALVQNKQQLVELSAGDLPLQILLQPLNELSDQVEKEQGANQDEALLKAIKKRDAKLMKWLKKRDLKISMVDDIAQYLAGDLKRTGKKKALEIVINGDNGLHKNLEKLIEMGLSSQLQQAEIVLAEQFKITQAIDRVSTQLSRVPDENLIAGYVKKRQAAAEKYQVLSDDACQSDESLRVLNVRKQQLVSELDETLRSLSSQGFEDQSVARVIQYAEATESTLESFRSAVAQRHVAELGKLILENYNKLLHKKTLIHEVRIDPDSYELSLLNHEGQTISNERLSAGERQLLAVSILSSLAKSAGRPLPVVIDTPLSRLDGDHRGHLVKRYFPNASHQVLLFSTDEEIDEAFYEELKPSIGHSYRLKQNDDERCTTIEPGYFWN